MQSRDTAEVVRVLMESTCIFVSDRIYYSVDREAYIHAMERCYLVCSEKISKDNLISMEQGLIKLRDEEPNWLFNFRAAPYGDVKKHNLMAINQCIDIVQSVRQRFDIDHFIPETIFVRKILRK